MKFKQRIKRNKKLLGKIVDEIIKEDILYKAIELDAKIGGDLNDASKARVYLEGIDRAYSMAFLNLKLITYIEKCHKLMGNQKEIESLLNDTTESINLIIKYMITQKMQYEGEEYKREEVENIVYYSDIKEHMKIPQNKIRQLNF